MGEHVTPRLYRGLRDYLPDQMGARQRIIDTIRGVYENYGFAPLGTPAIEYMDVLVGTGGQEANTSIFGVKGPEDEKIGLRFDLTVPLARVVSQYPDLPRPFRRYQVSPVWRADKPDRGRYREFTQFDIDAVGVETDLADTEIMAAMADTLTALKVGPFRVRFSSRKILELLLKFAEVPPVMRVKKRVGGGGGGSGGAASVETVEDRPATDVFRVLDKLDKIGIERVRLELTTGYKDDSGDFVPGLGLDMSQVRRIEEFLAIKGDSRQAVLDQLARTFAGVGGAEAEISVIRRISDTLGSLGYGDDRIAVDLSIARGLAYYTGPVFEAVLLDAPQFGSVFGGGRYDDLVLRFLGERVPATGASIGVDRLLAALVELKRIDLRPTTSQVLVAVFDQDLRSEYVSMAFELRRAGVPTELYLGSKAIGKQIKYADQQRIPVVVLVGSDEHSRGVVVLKEMNEGRQKASEAASRSEWLRTRPGQLEVPRADLVPATRQLLAMASSTA
ncbi:MAG: histidine--tRNA ligase [Phycisphaerales bacterium]